MQFSWYVFIDLLWTLLFNHSHIYQPRRDFVSNLLVKNLIILLKIRIWSYRDASPQLTSMKLCFISVDSALNFGASNQSKFNYWGRDLNTSLVIKINVFSCWLELVKLYQRYNEFWKVIPFFKGTKDILSFFAKKFSFVRMPFPRRSFFNILYLLFLYQLLLNDYCSI